jgi:hypothetical protein
MCKINEGLFVVARVTSANYGLINIIIGLRFGSANLYILTFGIIMFDSNTQE